jgi:transcription elongation factor Elf1
MYSHCPKCGSDKSVKVKVVEWDNNPQFQFGCHDCELFGKSESSTTYAKVSWDSMVFNTFVDR